MKLTEAVIVIVLYNWAGLREVKPPGWSHTAGNQQKTGSSMSGLQLTRPLGAQFRNISHRKSARAREDAHRMASLPTSKITEGVVLKSQSDLNRCVGKSLFLKPLWDFTFDFLPLPKVHPYPATRPGLSLSVMNVFLSLPLVLPAICLEAGASPWLFQLCIHHINFLEETLTSHRSSGDLASSHTSPWLRSSIFFPLQEVYWATVLILPGFQTVKSHNAEAEPRVEVTCYTGECSGKASNGRYQIRLHPELVLSPLFIVAHFQNLSD